MSAVAESVPTLEAETSKAIRFAKKGDLTLYLVHIQEGSESPTPALYLRNENRRPCPAVIIRFVDFWMFRTDDPDIRKKDMLTAARRIVRYCNVLYGLEFKSGCVRIRDAILEFVDDVKNQKPPAGMTREAWINYADRHGIRLAVDGEVMLGA